MRIENGINNLEVAKSSLLRRDKREAIATIGSFDGVHRGHQRLLGQVRRIADEYELNAVAITFGTSPKKVLGGGDVSQLTSSEERTTLLHHFGMDKVAVLDFTPQMAEMTAYDFMLKEIGRASCRERVYWPV